METIKTKPIDSFIYLDESGIDDNEEYPYAWGKKGPRIYALKPGKRQKRLSIISALHKNTLKAPFVFEGSCNREVFETYLLKVLLPVLKPGQTIIMDNASFHKNGKIKALIESAGCDLLYLPAYSPDFNPIEHQWAPLKHHIRKALPSCKRNLYAAAEHAFDAISIHR